MAGSVEADPRIGSEIAGYRIERLLGRGGMSVVYLAHDPRLDRRVALKLLAPELSSDEKFRERFLRESQLAASLDHPNVIPIFVVGGLMGWSGGTLGVATSSIGCIALGLAVDDTAHVLGHLRPGLSLRSLFREVGPPIILTTLSLGVGFLVLTMSQFGAVAIVGLATTLTLILALAADLIVLPSLLVLCGWKRAEDGLRSA